MNPTLIAVIIQEGGRLFSELLRLRSPKELPVVKYPSMAIIKEKSREKPVETKSMIAVETKEKATEPATGCVPCALGHYGTCSGLLNEAVRFARKDGITSGEVIDRVNMCLDEFNTMERVDLRPELVVALPPWEKELADKALTESRATRHSLESLSNVSELETVAASTQEVRQKLGRTWFKKKLGHMSPEEKEEVTKRTLEKLEKLEKEEE